MNRKFHIKKGDKVTIISGENKGKEGVVLTVDREKERAIVEGVNMVTKHVKPTAEKPEGGVKQMEAPIHVSNIKLIDPESGNATRVGRKLDENGKLKRYSKNTGKFID
ncbi:50S ribosomal protein L24 [Flammeovirga yaeyamensis]|uniref:Large ribosomal subunit protein uL24 n=1 Tax=Flammeovirga yaeyamensis TaxID=367791 RepID=A0AAX1N6T4_9BACT|nr:MULTISPECIES: 50S ribosomal protein L24 [Flammeovirga]ANQ50997.1 50S ribosomal protein L24 [Flammeovirga sp. MY04]MBB3701125.1 large subunit ribosomal protein L24 [Flammeovirga yaeyamensis]NMF38407.1 50S ribosomal protein L24 [Flammeovirga yaeyamensis]QWG01593.1 50S ribosomal protein L24 [Flammeovirga yaeyamensis]